MLCHTLGLDFVTVNLFTKVGSIASFTSLCTLFKYFLSSIFSSLKINVHGISNPPCSESEENRLLPVTMQDISPPHRKKREQAEEIFLGRWPTVTPDQVTATA